MELDHYVRTRLALIEETLERLVPHGQEPCPSLFEAARYSLLGAGKRLRPLLTLAAAETFGAPTAHALQPACALELIHTYSMIHDDLPCMDDDDFRRGKPTLHKLYPEGHAVLAGDYLLTYAFEVMATAEHLSAAQRIEMVTLLAQAAGGHGMVAGQAMDLEAEGKPIALETLQKIHHCKTGALITVALQLGGIIGQAKDPVMEQLSTLGNRLGLAFQIVDDILDVSASETKHGKAISSDVMNAKSTYVTLLGLENSRAKAQQLLQESYAILNQLPGDSSMLRALAHRLINRTA